MKIHEVLEKKISEIKMDELVQGILITGSLARGTETEYSDLDIIVLYEDSKLVEEVIDGVPVETHYNTYDSIKSRLIDEPSSAYLYIYGKIIEDKDGKLCELSDYAKSRLSTYHKEDVDKGNIAHKMQALKEKLNAAINLNDTLKISYLIHNNFKLIIEAVYLKNALPVPPQGLLYEIYDNLSIKPCEKWIEKLLTLKGRALAEFALECIKQAEVCS